jgi:polyhydroxyalkanoate synthesis repressor PhaR
MALATIKKYSNRRLYDTEESRYITLEELTEMVRRGTDVRVIDAKSGEDLTQPTLVQLILESNAAKLLPVPLLAQLIRMQDDALAEFLGRYVSAALEVYLTAKRGAQAVAPYFPLAQVPFSASHAMARALGAMPGFGDVAALFQGFGGGQFGGQQPGYPQPQPAYGPPPYGQAPGYGVPSYGPSGYVPPSGEHVVPPPPPPGRGVQPPSPPPSQPGNDEVAALRSELDALRREMRAEKPKKAQRSRSAKGS